jgi:hypothetical protein
MVEVIKLRPTSARVPSIVIIRRRLPVLLSPLLSARWCIGSGGQWRTAHLLML